MSLARYPMGGQPQQKIRPEHLDRAAAVYLLSELGREFYQFKDGFWCAGLRSFAMIGQDEPRDLAALVVPQAGWLEHAEDPWQPYRLRDPAGAVVGPVAAFLRDLQASGRPETTLRVCGRAIALVPVLVGGRGGMGSGDPRRGPGLQPVDPDHDQARPRGPSGRCGPGPALPGSGLGRLGRVP